MPQHFNLRSPQQTQEASPLEAAGLKIGKPYYPAGSDNYKKDLNVRRGGLKLNRSVDVNEINAINSQIASGALTGEEAEVWIHRNPGAASLWKGTMALKAQQQQERAKRDEILGGAFRPEQAAFQAEGPVQQGAEPRPFVPQQESQFDVARAQRGLLGGGFTAEAKQLGEIKGLGTDRKILKDVTDRQRFVDTGALVFPMVGEKPLTTAEKAAAEKAKRAITSKKFDNEKDLRKEFFKDSGEFIKVRDSFSRIEASAKDPSAAGDLSMIFNYMKMLDPGSVVRESEFATAAASGSLGDRFIAVGAKILAGQRLSPKQRNDFKDRADRLFKRQNLQHSQRKRFFGGLAKRNKLSVKNVVADIGQATEQTELEALDAEIAELEAKIASGQ